VGLIPKFVELIGAARQSAEEYLIELTPPDWVGPCCMLGEEWNHELDHAANAATGCD